MNGQLGKQHSSVTLERRCRFGIPPHVRTSTLRGDFFLRLASDHS
jgi:hypothetical protein